VKNGGVFLQKSKLNIENKMELTQRSVAKGFIALDKDRKSVFYSHHE
jgi:hypothetical protein